MMLDLNGIKSLHEEMYNEITFLRPIDKDLQHGKVLHFFEKFVKIK